MISITAQPTASSLKAAYLPVEYLVSQSGVTSLVPPALDVTALNESVLFTTFPAGITRASGAGFQYSLDLSGAAASQIDKLAGLPSPISSAVRSLTASVVKLSARFDEYAPNASGLLALTGDSETSDECYVIDAYRRADDADSGISTYGAFATPRFLTRRSRTAVLPITMRDTITVFNASYSGNAAPTESLELTAVFTFYSSDGTEISKGTLELPYPAGSLVQFPIGPADISELTLSGTPASGLSNIARYTVEIGRESLTGGPLDPSGPVAPTTTSTGDIIDISISRAPCNYTRVYFYNSFGAWEMALFEESTTRRHDLSGSNYARFGQVITEQRRSRMSVQVSSNTYTVGEADALLDLANSQLIYLYQSNQLIPVTLSAGALPVAYGPGSNGAQPFQFTLRATTETRSQRSY